MYIKKNNKKIKKEKDLNFVKYLIWTKKEKSF